MKPGTKNSYNSLSELKVGTQNYKYYSLAVAEKNGLEGISKLPKSLKVLLENLLRYEDNVSVNKKKIEAIKDWLKIKLNFDNYVGYIKNSNFKEEFYPTLKVKNLSAKTFQLKKGRFTRLKQKIFFGSKIMILKKYGNYFEFEKNKWINKKDLIIKGHIEKNYIKIFFFL